MAFTKAERGLIGGASLLVFTRVFAFSLTVLGFTEYAKGLNGASGGSLSADTMAGIALGAYGATMALAQLASGWLSDRIGRRPVLLAGSLLFMAGAVASALVDDVRLLIAARLLMGLGGVSSVYMAAVGETVPEERRTRAMAMVGIPAGLGVFLGFAVGPIIADHWGFASLFWCCAALGFVAMLPALRTLPAPLPGLADVRRSLSRPVLGLGLAGFSINYAMMVVMFQFQTDVLPSISHVILGLILLAALVVMGAVSRRVDRSGVAHVALALALACLVLAAPAFRLLSNKVEIIVAGIAFFAAHATLSAVIPSQVSKLAGRSGGTGHGFQLVVAYMGTSLGGALAGYFASRLIDAFAVLAVTALLSIALVWRGLAQPSSERPAASEP